MELIDRLRKHFAFLQRDLGYREIKVSQRKRDREFLPVVLYANDTTAIRIHYEVREAWMIVSFYPLAEGTVTEAARDGARSGYALPHIVVLEKPELELGPMKSHDTGLSPERRLNDYIGFQAQCVRRYAKDFLRGDFSRGPQADAVGKEWLKAREEELNRPPEEAPDPATDGRRPRRKTPARAAKAPAPRRRRKS